MIGGINIKYPLSENDFNIKSKSGKYLKDISIDEVIKGNITGEDIKVSKETLKIQGEIAKKEGRDQLGENFERASELVEIPDDELLIIYNMLRPYRSSENELLQKAKEIKVKFGAIRCSELIMDALKTYKKRGILRNS
ncbi:diol dehydratase small subunit [Clostridium chauvoei]|uniref:Diol dehydratase small subunit n=1 Tax=Clostridium chauvoei TaxID=46867 RepID=A0ABD4RDY6_9CLOT|nr:diol dehydratase small subunit [Clostridium chauvoei]MBX7279391.1 diol dehydratase small subunit [Clostridium chauvoei]MBX7282523.1 diol dehydratase small subunit [Clostridium chauvoei]MBX7285589.1 diol dehydratase small subunit [Clostridium chauvoei]MBX7287345.1 diol dehydratase small subunit [Clostridium chauvoei]MBX7289481.1 diol dehydratase small subunit [Clostridium chauvoei]